MSNFWKLYLLFFIVPFPMIIYYTGMSNDPEQAAQSSPQVALLFLALILALWTILLWQRFKKDIRSLFREQKQINWLLHHGHQVQSEVIAKQVLKRTAEGEHIDLKLQFLNFSGTPSRVEIKNMIDSKPHSRRYEPGEHVMLRLDPELHFPCLTLAGSQAVANKKTITLRVGGFLAIALFFAAYLYFAYRMEGNGVSWQFLTFWHPLIIIPLSYLFFTGIFRGFFARFFPKPAEQYRFLLYGKEALASVVDASQTGTYINKQPQIRFRLNYSDDAGNRHTTELKQIVNLLEMHTVGQKERKIRYLPDNFEKVQFV